MPEAADNVELYDVVEDPNERRNLVRFRKEKEEKMSPQKSPQKTVKKIGNNRTLLFSLNNLKKYL